MDTVQAFLARRGNAFWSLVLVAIGALIFLPRLGAYPLWDPWEPHYLQVAWEMQDRGTWMNPWYRGEDNWWSKPILLLWIIRAGIAALWDPLAHFPDHELAARLPFALIAIAGGVLQFDWVRRLYGRTAGFIAGVVLVTAPQYVVIGRQVMIDVTFVITYAASLGYLAVGLFTPRPELARADAPMGTRIRAWLAREWPFVAFWALEALSLLAKGFVSQTLVVIVLAGYAIATFRWRDYANEPEWTSVTRDGAWKRYLLTRGGLGLVVLAAAVVACVVLPKSLQRDQRHLYQALLVAPALLVTALAVFREFPFSRHVLNLLTRVRASWGLPLFLALGGPWYVYMTFKHGWPYWNEFIFYHHLGRAAGTIDKPGNTFDYFVRQLAYALFPWSAFALPALWQFVTRSSPFRSVAERRNFFMLVAIALPFLFFGLSGTKFAHYIFPVVPILGAVLAVGITWLGRERDDTVVLGESGPPVGTRVPGGLSESPWWERDGARGDLIVIVMVALVCFGVFSYDLVSDFRYVLRLFIYYWNRATPAEYQPYIALQYFTFPLGLTIGALLLSRWVTRVHVAVFGLFAVGLAAYYAWVMMPAMKDTYTYKPLYTAAMTLAKPDEPIGQYNDWQQPERSVIFLFQNRCQHLSTDKKAEAFLRGAGRKFVIVDNSKLAALRRVAAKLNEKLYIVNKDHPYGLLVSNVPNAEDVAQLKTAILTSAPEDITKVGAELDGKVRLVGFKASTTTPKRGETVTVDYFFEALQLIDEDWQVFVHADGTRGNSHRIGLDHYPVGGLHPTNEWQVGAIVRDTFEVKIPSNYPYDAITLWAGMYSTTRRMEITTGPSDGDNRIRTVRLSISK